MKAFVLPERVELRRNVLRSRAQASQRGDVLVPDCKSRQRFRKSIAIVLQIRARARHLADIGDHSDLRALEQVDELVHRASRMSDGEERMRHMSLWITGVCVEARFPYVGPRGRSCRS
jgi:hypothetical protein